MKKSDSFPLGLYQGILFWLLDCMHPSARRAFIKQWRTNLAREDLLVRRSPAVVEEQKQRIRDFAQSRAKRLGERASVPVPRKRMHDRKKDPYHGLLGVVLQSCPRKVQDKILELSEKPVDSSRYHGLSRFNVRLNHTLDLQRELEGWWQTQQAA